MITLLPWRVALGPLACAGALTALCAQFFPSLGTLEHEFTSVFCAVSALMVYGMAGAIFRRTRVALPEADAGPALQTALFLLIAGGLAMAAAALSIMYLFNVFRHGCYFGRGMPFFWITWGPIVFMMAVLGLWTASRGWGWVRRPLFFIFLGLLLFLHNWILVERGLRIVDPLFGVPLGFDQRAAIETPHLHIYQRVGLVMLALSLWATVLWRKRGEGAPAERQTIQRRWLQLSWAVTLLYLFGAGSYAGWGLGDGKIRGTLSQTYESENFVFHYAPHGKAEANRVQTVRYAEWNWARLTPLMEIAPRRKVVVYIADDLNVLWDLSGFRAANALPWRMMINDDAARTDTFPHELVHAFDLGDARSDPARTSPWASRWKLLKLGATEALYRGVTEGLAQAYSDEFAMTPYAHQRQAAALAEDKLPPAGLFMGFDGFRKVNESNAYYLAGSFMGFLLQTYGPEAMNRLLDDRRNFLGAFGMDLDGLDAQWRDFLREVPVSTRDVATMGRSFDVTVSRGITEKCCPKLGLKIPELEDVALQAYHQGRYPLALDAYGQLHEESGDPRHVVQQIKIYQTTGDMGTALARIEELLQPDDLSPAQRLEYSRLQANALIRQRDWEALGDLVARWSEIEPDAEPETLRLHRLLMEPAARERMALLLTADDDYEKRRAIESLAEEFPEDGDIAYLYLAHVYGRMWPRWNRADIAPENRTKLAVLLPYIESNPELADRVGPSLERFIDRAIFAGDWDLAERIVSLLEAHTGDPLRAHRMVVMRERIAFERNCAAC